MNLEFIEKILDENKDITDVFKRNIIKEYLQILVLSFIYSNENYQNIFFYGGSCLRHCYNLSRLSEDLDFIDLENVDLTKLTSDLKNYFEKIFSISINTKIQKFRIYLKFPILHSLKLANRSESNLLILKLELFPDFEFCKSYNTEIIPVFKFDKSILIKTFDLPTLMATKIRAILYRKWGKTTKNGITLAKVKGRDYFDLMWYLGKNVQPNLNCIERVNKKDNLKKLLLETVKNMDEKSIAYDLESLIKDEMFIKNLSKNIKDILLREIERKL